MKPFDWQRAYPQDVGRPFPPIIGKGRGKVLDPQAIDEARRKLQKKRLTSKQEAT